MPKSLSYSSIKEAKSIIQSRRVSTEDESLALGNSLKCQFEIGKSSFGFTVNVEITFHT